MSPTSTPPSAPPAWQPILLGAMAGGLGWGIRGQYGHETGAMMAGLLVGLVMVLLFCPNASSLATARAVAWCTVAIGFGGCMTYGQTVGLTHDAALVGNWPALRWGLLGLSIKGGIWIGFAGVFLGMGLGGVRYRALELWVLMLTLLGLFFVGVWLINSPYDPASHVLPKIYFSADWRWQPGAALKPRREVWGGLLLALTALLAFTRELRGDRLAFRLGLWAFLGGAIGFPLGQCLQAYHAWNRELFTQGFWSRWDPNINWWNFMETTFGATAGAMIGLGLWLNRRQIAPPDKTDVTLCPALEWSLIATHVVLLTLSEFGLWRPIEFYSEFSLVLGMIPVVLITGGRWFPYLLVLPITALPIAGKTLRELLYREHAVGPWPGWLLYLALPLGITTAAALLFARAAAAEPAGRRFLPGTLLIATWIYFGLNFAFFRFPWPWSDWTSRTPNALVYTLCAIGLTGLALRKRRGDIPRR